MIEIVALMVGQIVQAYSEQQYETPTPIRAGMFVNKGVPKSIFRPGSSTDLLLFQKKRVAFCEDLLRNMAHPGVDSRFSIGFQQPLAETDIQIRSPLARPAARHGGNAAS